MAEPRPRGWHPDPFGIHHERFYYEDDQPGRLVRDERIRESFDDPPGGFPPSSNGRHARPAATVRPVYAAAAGAPASAVSPAPRAC